jgi:hypothetical protein
VALAVRGLTELTRTFNHAPADVNLAYRSELGDVAEPVRLTAESLATSSIRRIGPVWSQMRTGITTRLVYVAPKQRGSRGRGSLGKKRPNLGTLLSERALQPALDRSRSRVEAGFDRMLDRLVNRWDHDGP